MNSLTAERIKAFGAFMLGGIAVLGVILLAARGETVPDILIAVVGASVGFFFGVANTNGQADKIAQAMTAIDAVNAARVRHDAANAATVQGLANQLVERGVITADQAASVTAKAAASVPTVATLPTEPGNLA